MLLDGAGHLPKDGGAPPLPSSLALASVAAASVPSRHLSIDGATGKT